MHDLSFTVQGCKGCASGRAPTLVPFVVNVIATALNFGDRTQIGAVHLPTSLVAVLQLAAAALVWFFAPAPLPEGAIVSIVSLSAGAVLANVVSIVILIVETTVMRR